MSGTTTPGATIVDPASIIEVGQPTVTFTPQGWMSYFYPYFFDAENVRYVSDNDIKQALAIAADYRPKCLNTSQQDQAQAHYAAYVLDYRFRAQRLSVSSTNTGVVAGPVIEKREGETSIKFATNITSAAAIQSQLTGPGTPYAAWYALWGMCLGIVVEGETRVRPGGIITRFGLPK